MFFLRFADAERERRLLLALAGDGILMKRGAYEFPSLAHADADAERTIAAVARAFREKG